jgi:hypothetical protein
MTNRVLLNNVDHGDLRVATGHGPAFGDAINQVLIFPTEFEAVQREYPIFFRKDADGAFQSVALLGLDRDENLFLDDASPGGGWNARYVPAIQQRGPFSIAMQRDERGGEPMIHVDLDHPRVAPTARASRRSCRPGATRPTCSTSPACWAKSMTGWSRRKAMFAAFEALGLIEPVDVEIKLDDHTQYDLPDLFTISPGPLGRPGRRRRWRGCIGPACWPPPNGSCRPWAMSGAGRAEEPQARGASRAPDRGSEPHDRHRSQDPGGRGPAARSRSTRCWRARRRRSSSGMARDWPLVQAGLESRPRRRMDYLLAYDRGESLRRLYGCAGDQGPVRLRRRPGRP